MTRRLISTGSSFEKTIGYSRAVVQETSEGVWCFVSGTTGYDYASMAMPADPAEQTRNTLATIERALADAGLGFADVVRTRYYLTDRDLRPQIVPLLGAAFGDIRPASTLVICDLAEPEMKIEIDVDAFRPKG